MGHHHYHHRHLTFTTTFKHTAKEIQAKVDAATTNRSYGTTRVADRTRQLKGGHAKFECPHCKTTALDIKTMQIHHESKHPKIPYGESKITNLHSILALVAESKITDVSGLKLIETKCMGE